MLYPQVIILGLAATVSAIDAYFHLGDNCDGPSFVCNGINPNACCVGASSNTVAWRGIPTNWAIRTEAYVGGNCRTLREGRDARNTNYICIQPNSFTGPFTGAQYHFLSRKRASEALGCPESDTEETAGKPCTSSQKASLLELEDGTRYNILDLEEGVLDELVCYDYPHSVITYLLTEEKSLWIRSATFQRIRASDSLAA
jgi:hypothetical protein